MCEKNSYATATAQNTKSHAVERNVREQIGRKHNYLNVSIHSTCQKSTYNEKY